MYILVDSIAKSSSTFHYFAKLPSKFTTAIFTLLVYMKVSTHLHAFLLLVYNVFHKLLGTKLNFIIVWICIYLITGDNFFIYLLIHIQVRFLFCGMTIISVVNISVQLFVFYLRFLKKFFIYCRSGSLGIYSVWK